MSEFQLTQSVYQNRQELRISRADFDRYLAQVAQPLEAENKRLREALEEVKNLIGPCVGRFSDGEPINPIGHAYDLIEEKLTTYQEGR